MREVNDNYANTFRIEDGVLKVRYDEGRILLMTGLDVFYKDTFSHYLLRLSIDL